MVEAISFICDIKEEVAYKSTPKKGIAIELSHSLVEDNCSEIRNYSSSVDKFLTGECSNRVKDFLG